MVFNPQGKVIGHIRLPERCANLCFGGAEGNRLFMAGSHPLYALYMNARGADFRWARCSISLMQLTTGTVVGGKIVVEGDPLPEGTVVTILARETDETFVIPPELEAELLESIAEADRGETTSADEVLRRLRDSA